MSKVDEILKLIEDGLVSAEGQTCGDGVTYAAQPLDDQNDSHEPHVNPPAIRFDSRLTVRRVEPDGTLSDPIEGVTAVAGQLDIEGSEGDRYVYRFVPGVFTIECDLRDGDTLSGVLPEPPECR